MESSICTLKDIKKISKLTEQIRLKGSLEVLYILNKYNQTDYKGVSYTGLKQILNISFGTLYPTLKRLLFYDLIKKNKHFRIFIITEEGIKLLGLINLNEVG